MPKQWVTVRAVDAGVTIDGPAWGPAREDWWLTMPVRAAADLLTKQADKLDAAKKGTQ